MPPGSKVRKQFEDQVREMVFKSYGMPWWKVSDRIRGALDAQAMKAVTMSTTSDEFVDHVENTGHLVCRLLEEEGVKAK